MYIAYLLDVSYIILGYTVGYIICKYIKPEAFLIIFFKNKKYSIKLHHSYILLLSVLAALYNLQYIMLTSLGIGIHDLLIEIRKKLNNIFISKNS